MARRILIPAVEVNVVEQVASCLVNLVEQNAIKLDSVLLGVCNQFLEWLVSLVLLAVSAIRQSLMIVPFCRSA